MSEEIFDFDEFFVPEEDKGELVMTPINGRDVPIYLKRGLSIDAVKASQSKAMKITMSPNGQPIVGDFDEAVFSAELLYLSIKSWPFTKAVDTKDGPKRVAVPITRENAAAMLYDGGLFLQEYISKRLQKKEAQMRPFAPASDVAS